MWLYLVVETCFGSFFVAVVVVLKHDCICLHKIKKI